MKIIIPIFVGAVIGYITNWLAIKMLFRPHGEKKIFGMKIPFTPGLIPKEKERIAKSVGDAVGTHLLTPEAIKQVLSSNETNEQVDQWLYEKVRSLKDKEESISELIKGEDSDNLNNLKHMGAVNIKKIILNELSEPKFNKGIISFIENNIFDNIFEDVIREVRTRGIQLLGNVLRSDDIKNVVNSTINRSLEELHSNNKSLKELLSSSTENDVRDLLNNNKIKIGNTVRNVFNDPHIHNKLKNSISLMVDENINPMITIFISPDQISEKIIQIVEKYINDPKSTDDYIMLLSNVIDKLMSTTVSEVTLNLKPFLNESNIDNLSKRILGQISDEEINMVISSLEREVINSKDILKRSALEYLSSSIDTLVKSESFEAELKAFIGNSMNNLMNIPIHTLLKDVDDSIIANLISLLKTTFNTFAEHELPKIMELFNVSGIVEKQINSFDVEYTEKLILDIANKELKAITWLGALLGGIMGLLSPILQML